MNLVTLHVNMKNGADLKKGYPLILKDAVTNAYDLEDEGELIRLVDQNNFYIATGYYGVQNKGIGWILTTNEEEESF